MRMFTRGLDGRRPSTTAWISADRHECSDIPIRTFLPFSLFIFILILFYIFNDILSIYEHTYRVANCER
jgi:hypothetical protein